MKNRIEAFLLNNKFVFLAFFLPVILAVIGLACNDIYPFGGQQILVIDMYHQYLPFLSEFQYKLQHGESLFYTWNGAGGSNFWNLIAYYCASPLNLLLALIPSKFIVEGMTIILLIKIGLAGAFVCIYLRESNKICNLGTAAMASLYALCSFVMGYYWCIMWIDAVLLLPLVILGLQRIIEGRGPVLFCVSLALTVFCNYYISIMVCIFVMFYYPVCYFSKVKGASPKECAITTFKSIGYSLLAIAMAAVMLLPTYLSMQSTYYISQEFPDAWEVYNNIMDVLNQLLPYSELTFREGLPNLCSGLLVVMLMVYYILEKTISLREKALHLGLLVFLFLSVNVNKLNFIWHGFHFPNQLPYRFSFVISFLLIALAYKALVKINNVRTNVIWATMAGIIGWYVLSQKLLADHIDDMNVYIYLGLALLIAYTSIIMVYKKQLIKKPAFLMLISLVICVELGFTTVIDFEKVGNSDRDYYFTNYGSVEKLLSEVKDEFARVEMDDNFILNTPAFYHYKGISQFSSSINSNATYLMEKIGEEGEPAKNRFNYRQTAPVLNSILNIKYLIGKSDEINDPDFKQIDKKGYSYLYENQKPLAPGYMVSDAIWTWDVDMDNPFSVLDDYVRAATGNKYQRVFNEIDAAEISGENLEYYENGDQAWLIESEGNDDMASMSLTYNSEKTQKYYVFVEGYGCDTITVDSQNSDEIIDLREDSGAIVNVGVVKKGQSFTINASFQSGSSGDLRAHVCSLDGETWDQVYQILATDTLQVEEWSSTKIKGTIDVTNPGVMATSIPYEEGWTLKIDGKKKEVDQMVGGGFIAANLGEGQHEIEMTFRPPGFIAGAIISLLSVLILVVIVRWGSGIKGYFSRRRQELKEPEEFYPEESDCNIEDRYCSEE